MIPVAQVAEPPGFVQARQRGNAWLQQHPNHGGKVLKYWRPFRNALREGFQRRCGYTAMYESVGTVDHFVSVKTEGAGQ